MLLGKTNERREAFSLTTQKRAQQIQSSANRKGSQFLPVSHMLLKGVGAGNANGEGCSGSTFEEFAPLDTCYQGAEDETWQAVYWAGLPSLVVCAVLFALGNYIDAFL